MTDENLLDRITGASSRRSFLKKGSLASAGLALGGTGTALAQDEGGGEQGDQQGTQGFMFPNQFVADARFTVDAGIDWTPGADQQEDGQQGTATEQEDDQQDGTETDADGGDDSGEGDGDEGGDGDDAGNESALQDQGVEDQLQTYVIQYDFSESHYAFLFVPQETEIEEGQTYQLASSVTGGEQPPIRGTVAVNFSPAGGGQDVGDGDEGGGEEDAGGDEGEGGDGGDTGDDGDTGDNENEIGGEGDAGNGG